MEIFRVGVIDGDDDDDDVWCLTILRNGRRKKSRKIKGVKVHSKRID